jgi:fructosamine-3-kinase
MDGALRAALAAALGASVARATPVHGGDTAMAYRIDLDDGRALFAKTHAAPPPGFFSTEAASLTWLRAADAIAVPAVVAVSDEAPAHLVLEWIDEGRPHDGTETELGRALAALHAAGAPAYGREDRRTTGSLALPNTPATTWAEFYARDRLLPLARIARERGRLPETTIDRLETLAGRLERFGPPEEGPSRLHGDLWAGNRLVDGRGRSWLIDPAAHGGHREFDLAMMRLFGGFGPACFGAYQESRPQADGWADRVSLHQIAPLVVHAVKFGGSYVGAAQAAIQRYA